MELKDKRIVLTGGSSGIGRELAARLARENDVIVTGRNEVELAALARRFARVEARKCDLSRPDEVEALARALSRPGTRAIDVLICNAATQSQAGLADSDFEAEVMEAEVAVNFTSVCRLIARLLPWMGKGATGSVIALVNSGLAIAPKRSAPVYCATKAALRSLAQSLAFELEGSRVRVVQVYLPLVDTPMTTGRGRNKLTAAAAAEAIARAIEAEQPETLVGKVRQLWWLHRLAPGVARRIMAKL